ncbi:MAG: MiaB/RimO family radical SAM methylthiotransferase [Caldisericia bacterium]|nr:MiaB/RimO family radical SAM methylthiotransferase [Caldisericia bacterium]
MKKTNSLHNKKTVSFVNLGCSKNTVISEKVAFLFQEDGYVLIPESIDTTLFVVNTCCFLEIARKECLDVLKNILDTYNVEESNIIVIGCYANRFPESIRTIFPNVRIVEDQDPYLGVSKLLLKPLMQEKRLLSTQHYAYIRISEGCSRKCAYCLIPSIKGPYKSYHSKSIFKDCAFLKSNYKVKEGIILAQDTSIYGEDFQNDESLISLASEMSKAKYFDWIRILYLYPTLSVNKIRELLSIPNVVPYLDIPMQHLHPEVLLKMHRPSNSISFLNDLIKLRSEFPNLTIRSTFIVGFPGETEEQFNFLINELTKLKLDRVGFFSYSNEKGTESYLLENQIPNHIKESRLEKAYSMQEKISDSIDSSYISKNLPVLVETYDPVAHVATGRSIREAPDVDPYIQIHGNPFRLKNQVGNIVNCKITSVKKEYIQAAIL